MRLGLREATSIVSGGASCPALSAGYVRRHHLALLALFVALGGTAYAAVQLERNQVESRHIGPGQVKKPDIAARAVNSAKVANRTLRRIDFAPGHLPAGATGATGATGPSGLTESSSSLAADTVTVTGCGDGLIRTLPITVTESSRSARANRPTGS